MAQLDPPEKEISFAEMMRLATEKELQNIKDAPPSVQQVAATESIMTAEQIRLEEMAAMDRLLGRDAIVIICDDDPTVIEFNQIIIDDSFGTKAQTYNNPAAAMAAFERASATGRPCVMIMDHKYDDNSRTGADCLRQLMATPRINPARFILQNGDDMVDIEGVARIFKPAIKRDILAVVRAELAAMVEGVVSKDYVEDELREEQANQNVAITRHRQLLTKLPLVQAYERTRRDGIIDNNGSERYWQDAVVLKVKTLENGQILPMTENELRGLIGQRVAEDDAYSKATIELKNSRRNKPKDLASDGYDHNDTYWQQSTSQNSKPLERE